MNSIINICNDLAAQRLTIRLTGQREVHSHAAAVVKVKGKKGYSHWD
jgi:hypothetical protein